jgi:hypothetical protein
MKKWYLALLAVLLLAVAACGSEDDEILRIRQIEEMPGDHLTVYMLDASWAGYPDPQVRERLLENAVKMTEIAQQMGFLLTFEYWHPIDLATGEFINFNHHMSSDRGIMHRSNTNEIVDATLDFMLRTNPGGLYMISTGQTIYDSENQSSPHMRNRALSDTQALGNFYDIARVHAPEYMRQTADLFNFPGHFTFMPAGYTDWYDYNALLIRNDLYDQYAAGQIIDSDWLEYILREIKRDEPDSAPGFVFTGGSTFSWAHFLLPEMGFTSLESMFVDGFMWMDENGVVRALHDMMDEMTAVSMRFMEWINGGLIDFAANTAVPKTEDLLNYPVIFTCTNNMMWLPGTEGMEDYTLHIFPVPVKRSRPPSRAFVAAPNTNIIEFLRFMELMKTDSAFYNSLMYGVEGMDYGDVNGQFIHPGHSERLNMFRILSNYRWHLNITKDMGIVRVRNWPEAILNMPEPKFPLDENQRWIIRHFMMDDDDYLKAAGRGPQVKLGNATFNSIEIGTYPNSVPLNAMPDVWQRKEAICLCHGMLMVVNDPLTERTVRMDLGAVYEQYRTNVALQEAVEMVRIAMMR